MDFAYALTFRFAASGICVNNRNQRTALFVNKTLGFNNRSIRPPLLCLQACQKPWSSSVCRMLTQANPEALR